MGIHTVGVFKKHTPHYGFCCESEYQNVWEYQRGGTVMATARVNGFVVDVIVKDAIPTVRISHSDGKRILETSDLSITGMERIGAAFARAAHMAYSELDHYYHQRQEDVRQASQRGVRG
jgi:hypothetical protein